MKSKIINHFKSLFIILICLLLGKSIIFLFNFHFPLGIIGLIILFIFLQVNIISGDEIESTCNIIIRYMSLAFIPISVGVVNHLDLLKDNLFAIVGSCVLSSICVLIGTSLFVKKMESKL